MEPNVSKSVKQAGQTINQAADAVSEKFKDGAQVASKKIEQTESNMLANFGDLQARAEEGLDSTYSIVKKYPLYSFLGAAAVGVLAGAFIKGIGKK